MSLKEKMKPVDDYFGYLLLFAGILVEVVLSLGLGTLNTILFAVPLVAFLVWTVLYIYGYRVKIRFRDNDELSFIETARAYMYFFNLAITLPLNFYVVFFPTLLNMLVIVVLVGVLLTFATWAIPRAFFLQQIILLDKQQKRTFYETLSFTGNVSIYYSITVSLFDLLIAEIISKNWQFSSPIPVALTVCMLFLLGGFFIYQREEKSRKSAKALESSLKKSEWKRRREARKRAQEYRRRRHQKVSTKKK